MQTVSITIPCRNEKKYIALCLNSIVNCNYDKELLTVFVVDGLSNDGTTEIIKNYETKYPFIHLIINEKQTTPFALNLGLQANNASIKIILGAHAEIAADYIDECIIAFTNSNELGCVGGIIENVMEDETSRIISLAMSSNFGVGNAHFRTGNKDGFVDTVAFGAYKNEVFKAIGFFDEELIRNQDDEFNFRLLKNGFKIYLSKKIVSKYYVRASLSKLFKQYYQYGYWKVFVNVKHKTVTTIRQIIPALFVSFLCVGFVISLFSKIAFLAYGICISLYIILALYSASAKSKNIIEIFKIVAVFLILHLSYGCGYLVGIFNFVLANKKPSKASEKLTR